MGEVSWSGFQGADKLNAFSSVWAIAAEALQWDAPAEQCPNSVVCVPRHGGHPPLAEAERGAEWSTSGTSALAKAGGIEWHLLLLRANWREFWEWGRKKKYFVRANWELYSVKSWKRPLWFSWEKRFLNILCLKSVPAIHIWTLGDLCMYIYIQMRMHTHSAHAYMCVCVPKTSSLLPALDGGPTQYLNPHFTFLLKSLPMHTKLCVKLLACQCFVQRHFPFGS